MGRVRLARQYLGTTRAPDAALKIVEEIRARPDIFPPNRTNINWLAHIEADAMLEKTNLPAAEKVLNKAMEDYPNDEEMLETAAQVYLDFGYYTNAIPLLERRIAAHPDDAYLLILNGSANLQGGRYSNAIPIFNRVMALDTNTSSPGYTMALMGRAAAYLKSEKLGEAKQDYETLQKRFPTDPRIYFGLGEIAYERRDTNAAILNYQHYLTNAPPSELTDTVRTKLKELRPGYPQP
jgi:tetratricopeptide (TPR) repeat protein